MKHFGKAPKVLKKKSKNPPSHAGEKSELFDLYAATYLTKT